MLKTIKAIPAGHILLRESMVKVRGRPGCVAGDAFSFDVVETDWQKPEGSSTTPDLLPLLEILGTTEDGEGSTSGESALQRHG